MMFYRCCAKIGLIVGLALCVMAAKPVTQRELDAVTQDLRCLTCPNETIADSTSPMALDVKRYIVERLEQGETKQEIVDTLTARYGEALRYKPVMNRHTYILWSIPAVCVLLGGFALTRVFAKRPVS
jgi:cytochrome c-type biogenesis protein CcmH